MNTSRALRPQVRVETALRAHSIRVVVVASPGAEGYDRGMHARCSCGWHGTYADPLPGAGVAPHGRDVDEWRETCADAGRAHVAAKILDALSP